MRARGDVEAGDARDRRPAAHVGCVVAADDVGVEARAADVFADLVDDQHIQAIDVEPGSRQASSSSAGSRAGIPAAGDHLDLRGFVVGVFQQRHAAEDLGLGERHPAHGLEILGHLSRSPARGRCRPRLPMPITIIFMRPLSQGPRKAMCGLMRLTTTIPSASAANRSRCTGNLLEETPISTVSMLERMGAPTVSSVDAHAGQHVALALGRGAAVAAHGREEEGLAAGQADLGGDGLQNERQPGDPAAAAVTATRSPAFTRTNATRLQLPDQLARNVDHLRPLEALPDLDNSRDGDRVQQIVDSADAVSFLYRLDYRS